MITQLKEKRKKRGASAGPDALAEALVRTFCLAAVLIREDPAAVCRGISLRDYYAKWIPRVCAPKKAGDPYAAGLYEERPDEVLLTYSVTLRNDTGSQSSSSAQVFRTGISGSSASHCSLVNVPDVTATNFAEASRAHIQSILWSPT